MKVKNGKCSVRAECKSPGNAESHKEKEEMVVEKGRRGKNEKEGCKQAAPLNQSLR